jgi:Fe2+ or Zn2+ uptake regulation protein
VTEPATTRIADLLNGKDPLTVEEICRLVWGRSGDRERNQVYQVLHKLREKGQLQTWEKRYQVVTRKR